MAKVIFLTSFFLILLGTSQAMAVRPSTTAGRSSAPARPALAREKPTVDKNPVDGENGPHYPGCKHSLKVKAVATYLKGGAVYDESAGLAKIEKNESNIWYKIPRWLAGTWVYYEGALTKYTDLKTGIARNDKQISHHEATTIWGWQKDILGDVWQYEDSPNVNKTRDEDKDKIVIYIRESNKLNFIDKNTLVCTTFYTYSAIEPRTLKIDSTYQSENICTYTLEDTGEIRRVVSSKIFDENGEPLVQSESYSLAKRIYPFKPIDRKGSKNFRAQFVEYLKSHDMEELIRPPEMDDDLSIFR